LTVYSFEQELGLSPRLSRPLADGYLPSALAFTLACVHNAYILASIASNRRFFRAQINPVYKVYNAATRLGKVRLTLNFQQREDRLIEMGLSLASSYCDLADTAVRRRDRGATARLASRARHETTSIRARIDKHGFPADSRALFAPQLSEIEERVSGLERKAA
jgi:hypothetical protein